MPLSGNHLGPERRLLLVVLLAFSFVAILPALCTSAPAGQDTLDVKTEPGGGIRAVAHVRFPAKPDVILAMLTDYARWPELFDLRMRVADVTIHESVATVDLRIDHALLPGERRLITDSRALSGGGIVTDLVGGDFKKYHRVWKLAPGEAGEQTVADFELIVAIDSVVPDWLVALAIRRELESHFRIVKEKALERVSRGK
jgi:hypothetical protein